MSHNKKVEGKQKRLHWNMDYELDSKLIEHRILIEDMISTFQIEFKGTKKENHLNKILTSCYSLMETLHTPYTGTYVDWKQHLPEDEKVNSYSSDADLEAIDWKEYTESVEKKIDLLGASKEIKKSSLYQLYMKNEED
jgi:hypothetical protein